MMKCIIAYIIDFLASFPVYQSDIIHYGQIQEKSERNKIIIVPAVRNFEIVSLPELPFKQIENIPILFGNSKIERQNGIIVVYADIIASSFFLLSRYEEILKPNCRDQHGRFLAQDSIIFQQGHGNRPLVDEYGMLLRKWLRDVGISVQGEKTGFSRIYLTHDVDTPFRYERLSTVFKQYIKNILHYQYSDTPLKKYFNEQQDEYYTFPKIINYDTTLQKYLHGVQIETAYFFLTSGSFLNRRYYDLFSRKIDNLIDIINASNANIGFHVSYEAGIKPKRIQHEQKLFKKKLKLSAFISRHHYLSWREPEDVSFLEQSGITDDFTLAYADYVGFRVGTCRPYRFIDPKSKTLTNVVIHPLEIMDCTLSNKNYMNLDFEGAFCKCKEIIEQVYKHTGELVLLWHNTEFCGQNYQEKLYIKILEYIKELRITS